MGLATWYDVAYYALLGLNAKKQHSLLHPSTWSAMWFTAAEQEAPICKWVRRFPRNPITSEGPAEMVMSSMVIQAMQCHPLCNNGQARTQHVPVSNAISLWQQNDGWHRLYYFDLLWGSNVLRCLTWVVAISCQFPDCWSSKEIASWMLTPITTTSDTQAGKTCLTWRRFGYEWSFQKASYFIEALDIILYHLMISYGWKCLKKHP